MEKRNSQLEHDSQRSKQEACFARVTRVWLAAYNTQHQCHFWRIETDVRSALHGHVSLVADNHILCDS